MKRSDILKQWGQDQSETAIQTDIHNLLATNGWLVLRFNNVGMFDPTKKIFRRSVNVPGVSDLICLKESIWLCVEVKKPSEKKAVDAIINGKIPKSKKDWHIRHQLDFIQNVREHGGTGLFAYSIDDVIVFLKKRGV